MRILAVRHQKPDPSPISASNLPNRPNSWAYGDELLEVSAIHPYITEEMGETRPSDEEELEYFLRGGHPQLVVDLVYYQIEGKSPRTVHCVTNCRDEAMVITEFGIQNTVRRVSKDYDVYLPSPDFLSGSNAMYFIRSGLPIDERKRAKAVCVADCLAHGDVRRWAKAMEKLVDLD